MSVWNLDVGEVWCWLRYLPHTSGAFRVGFRSLPKVPYLVFSVSVSVSGFYLRVLCIIHHSKQYRVAFDGFTINGTPWRLEDGGMEGWRDGGMMGRQNLFFWCVDVDVVGGVEVEVIVEVQVVMCM